MLERKPGSVEILCREIGFDFAPGMEHPRLLVAFVRQLVLEVAEMHWQRGEIARLGGGQPPSEGSGELLDKTLDMLNGGDIAAMVEQCTPLHERAHELNPDEAYPTDHLIDMLSSCVSAIRFGCDAGRLGFGSRHAAEAAQHVWRQRYGVSLFDTFTPRWQHEWARHKLQQALLALAFSPTKGGDEERPASAIEARQGEDAQRLHAEHESAAPSGETP